MAATLEIKYFNSFWLKKMKTITDVVPGSTSNYDTSSSGTSFVIQTALDSTKMNVGQKVTFTYNTPATSYVGYIVSRTSDTQFVVNVAPATFAPASQTPEITFGDITNFSRIPGSYSANSTFDWYEEEARIRGGYNNTIVDLGVKAYITEDNPNQRHRFNSLIYSGIFNPRTGVNNTNQFSVGEDISKSVDPAYASIQKLYAEDTNLIIFQEQKVSRALIDKDAIYSAEGNPVSTTSNVVIGQIVAYAGEYGISKDPFSFSVYGYRKYFTDRNRNCVCRLSQDGITEISSYGMHDFFRDLLSLNGDLKIVSAWDMHTKNYILSIQNTDTSSSTTTAPVSSIPQVMVYGEKLTTCNNYPGKCPVPPTVPVDQGFFSNIFTWNPLLQNTPTASTAQVTIQDGQNYSIGDFEVTNNYVTISSHIKKTLSPLTFEWRLVRFTYTSNASTGHVENYTYVNQLTYPADSEFDVQSNTAVRGLGSISDTEFVAVMRNTTFDVYQLVKIVIPPSGTEVVLSSLFNIEGDLTDGTGDIVVTFKTDGVTPNKVLIAGYSGEVISPIPRYNRIWQYDYATGVFEVVTTDPAPSVGVPALALVNNVLYASTTPVIASANGNEGSIITVSLTSPYSWTNLPMAKWPKNFGTHFNNLQGGTGYVTASNVATTNLNGKGMLVDIVAVSGVITELTISRVRDRNLSNSQYSLSTPVVTITGGNGDATITLTAIRYGNFAPGAASTPASRISDGFEGFPSKATTTTNVTSETVSFDEDVLGWTSRYDYYPDYIESLGANYYSFKSGQLFQHHKINPLFPNVYANYYGVTYDSSVRVILNGQPSLIKNFKTINYEGGTEWKMTELTASLVSSGVIPTSTGSDDIDGQISSTLIRALPISKYTQATSLAVLQGQLFQNTFKRKENKYFGNLVNNTAAMAGEVFHGQQIAGVKGFFAVVTMTLENSTANTAGVLEGVGKKELFSVSSTIVESSY